MSETRCVLCHGEEMAMRSCPACREPDPPAPRDRHERDRFVRVTVEVVDATTGARLPRTVDNPFRERNVYGQRCHGCDATDGVFHLSSCPLLRAALATFMGRLQTSPMIAARTRMFSGDIRHVPTKAEMSSLIDTTQPRPQVDIRQVVVKQEFAEGFDADKVAADTQRWAARRVAAMSADGAARASGQIAARYLLGVDAAKRGAERTGIAVVRREAVPTNVDYPDDRYAITAGFGADPARCTRAAIVAAVLAVAGVSRCEPSMHGPAHERRLTVHVWADVKTRMEDVYGAVERSVAVGVLFEVKVRLTRAAPSALHLGDAMRPEDVTLTSEEWSGLVKAGLAMREQARLPSCQTEVDADVDNFGDAP